MTPSHTASLSFPADERRRRVVADAVRPEVGEIDDDRSRATVDRDDDVTVRVEATDLIALRASLNTWFRLVGTAERVADAADERR